MTRICSARGKTCQFHFAKRGNRGCDFSQPTEDPRGTSARERESERESRVDPRVKKKEGEENLSFATPTSHGEGEMDARSRWTRLSARSISLYSFGSSRTAPLSLGDIASHFIGSRLRLAGQLVRRQNALPYERPAEKVSGLASRG